jgi:tRNA methyl transferase
VDVDTGKEVGRHSGMQAFTIGQGAKIGGCSEKYFVASLVSNPKSNPEIYSHLPLNLDQLKSGDVLVARGWDHPALLSTSLFVRARDFSWVAGRPPEQLVKQRVAIDNYATASDASSNEGLFRCGFKARYQQKIKGCSLRWRRRRKRGPPSVTAGKTPKTALASSLTALDTAHTHTATALLEYEQAQSQGLDLDLDLDLEVLFDEPLRAATPGQILALYLMDSDGNYECLGGGKIASGLSTASGQRT